MEGFTISLQHPISTTFLISAVNKYTRLKHLCCIYKTKVLYRIITLYRIVTFLQKWGSKDFRLRSVSDIKGRHAWGQEIQVSPGQAACLCVITAQQTRSIKQRNPSIHPLEFSPQWWEETPVRGHPDWQNIQIHTAWKVPRQSEFQLR